ncbi:MAG TPA: tail fiber assembly protein [Pseudomonas sp.]|nr:tail fiber assembly protein [Pseudomonas sp.]
MMDYVRVDNGVVVELFNTDLDISELFHPDLLWIDVSGIEPKPQEGWEAKEAGGQWEFIQLVEAPPSDEDLRRNAIYKRDYLIAAANESTLGMADAFIADLLSPEEVLRFKAFAKYKLLLNKIIEQPGFPSVIEWPTSPV